MCYFYSYMGKLFCYYSVGSQTLSSILTVLENNLLLDIKSKNEYSKLEVLQQTSTSLRNEMYKWLQFQIPTRVDSIRSKTILFEGSEITLNMQDSTDFYIFNLFQIRSIINNCIESQDVFVIEFSYGNKLVPEEIRKLL